MNEFMDFATYLFLGEFLAASLLADLMAFVIATWRTIAAIILTLASDALATAFAFLFRLENVRRHL